MSFKLVVEPSISLSDLMETMHIADGLECETRLNPILQRFLHLSRVIWSESLSDYWMSWDSAIEENSSISMMCFVVWKMAFDYLTENGFKGDVNEIDDDNFILEVFLFLPPKPEEMLNKLQEFSKTLEEARKEIQELKTSVYIHMRQCNSNAMQLLHVSIHMPCRQNRSVRLGSLTVSHVFRLGAFSFVMSIEQSIATESEAIHRDVHDHYHLLELVQF